MNRFAADSLQEGAGFEPSVPLELLTVSGSSLVVSADLSPAFPPENEVLSRFSAGGKRIRTLGPPRQRPRVWWRLT